MQRKTDASMLIYDWYKGGGFWKHDLRYENSLALLYFFDRLDLILSEKIKLLDDIYAKADSTTTNYDFFRYIFDEDEKALATALDHFPKALLSYKDNFSILDSRKDLLDMKLVLGTFMPHSQYGLAGSYAAMEDINPLKTGLTPYKMNLPSHAIRIFSLNNKIFRLGTTPTDIFFAFSDASKDLSISALGNFNTELETKNYIYEPGLIEYFRLKDFTLDKNDIYIIATNTFEKAGSYKFSASYGGPPIIKKVEVKDLDDDSIIYSATWEKHKSASLRRNLVKEPIALNLRFETGESTKKLNLSVRVWSNKNLSDVYFELDDLTRTKSESALALPYDELVNGESYNEFLGFVEPTISKDTEALQLTISAIEATPINFSSEPNTKGYPLDSNPSFISYLNGEHLWENFDSAAIGDKNHKINVKADIAEGDGDENRKDVKDRIDDGDPGTEGDIKDYDIDDDGDEGDQGKNETPEFRLFKERLLAFKNDFQIIAVAQLPSSIKVPNARYSEFFRTRLDSPSFFHDRVRLTLSGHLSCTDGYDTLYAPYQSKLHANSYILYCLYDFGKLLKEFEGKFPEKVETLMPKGWLAYVQAVNSHAKKNPSQITFTRVYETNRFSFDGENLGNEFDEKISFTDPRKTARYYLNNFFPTFFGPPEETGPDPNPDLECPSLLNDIIVENNNRSMLGFVRAPVELCFEGTGKRTHSLATPKKLHAFYEAREETALGLPPEKIDACVKKAYPIEDQLSALSEYYYMMARLRKATLFTIQSIAAIDSLLGKDVLLGGVSNCKNNSFLKTTYFCDTLRRCPAKNQTETLDLLSHATANAYEAVDYANKEIESIDNQKLSINNAIWTLEQQYADIPGASDPAEKIKKLKAQLEALPVLKEQLISKKSYIESLHPIIKGDVFKSTLQSAAFEDVKVAVIAQLEQNRIKLLEKLALYKRASSCLSKKEDNNADCSVLMKAVSESPDFKLFPLDMADSAPQTYKENLDGNQEILTAQCLRDARKITDRVDTALTDFYINSSLTVASMGLSGVAAGARATTTAVNATKTAKLAQAAKNLTSTKAGLAMLGILGADIYWASLSFPEIAHACASDLQGDSEDPTFTEDPSQLICPTDVESVKRQTTMTDYNSCVLAWSFAAVDALPFLSPVMVKTLQKAISKSPKLQANVEALAIKQNQLGKKLSEKKWIRYLFKNVGEVYDDATGLFKKKPTPTALAEELKPKRFIHTPQLRTVNDDVFIPPTSERWDVIETIPDSQGGTRLVIRLKPEFSRVYAAFELGFIDELVAGHPDLMAKFGIKLRANGDIELPGIQTLNARIEALRKAKDPLAPTFKFWGDLSTGEVDLLTFARHLADGEIPIGLIGSLDVGNLAFHDMNVHMTGYLLMPKASAERYIYRTKKLLEILDDPILGQNKAVKEQITNKLEGIVERVDSGSAAFSSAPIDIASDKATGGIATAGLHAAFEARGSESLTGDLQTLLRGKLSEREKLILDEILFRDQIDDIGVSFSAADTELDGHINTFIRNVDNASGKNQLRVGNFSLARRHPELQKQIEDIGGELAKADDFIKNNPNISLADALERATNARKLEAERLGQLAAKYPEGSSLRELFENAQKEMVLTKTEQNNFDKLLTQLKNEGHAYDPIKFDHYNNASLKVLSERGELIAAIRVDRLQHKGVKVSQLLDENKTRAAFDAEMTAQKITPSKQTDILKKELDIVYEDGSKWLEVKTRSSKKAYNALDINSIYSQVQLTIQIRKLMKLEKTVALEYHFSHGINRKAADNLKADFPEISKIFGVID